MPPKIIHLQRVSDNFGSIYYPSPVTSQTSSKLTLERAVLAGSAQRVIVADEAVTSESVKVAII